MITCCYTEISRQWSEQELTEKLEQLPEKLRTQALRKRRWMDKQLTIAGKLLLVELLKIQGLDGNLSLADLKYNAYQRPYFDGGFDFNIAHSGNMVICCGIQSGCVGIDIEQIKNIDLSYYTYHFSQREWANIDKAHDKYEAFHWYWTRKEAALKAIGTGFHTSLLSIDVSDETLIYEDITYYFLSLDVGKGYACHVASTEIPENIQLSRLSL